VTLDKEKFPLALMLWGLWRTVRSF